MSIASFHHREFEVQHADLQETLMSASERHRLLVEWNRTHVEFPGPALIHHMFEAQAENAADAVALVCHDRRLSYGELNRRANRLAHHLRTLGVGPEVLVGVCLGRSVSLITALLAILKAGGAYVPLDPAYPQDRLRFIAEDARLAVLLTEETVRDGGRTEGGGRRTEDGGTASVFPPPSSVLCPSPTQVIVLDADFELGIEGPCDNPATTVGPDNLAYVIYTSGSTGQPKGVAIEHRNAANFVGWARQTFAPQDLAGVLAATSICFDLSVFELFVTLAGGGKVILAANALELPRLAAVQEVTLINTVPSAINELVRLGGIPASVRVVNLAGEPLPTALVNKLYGIPTIRKVYDLYGPTETTTYSTFALRKPDEKATIGRPLANTQIYLLDANMQPVPLGTVGELYIGGAGVARGYLNRPELTAAKFITDPFAVRTEDGGRRSEDGISSFPPPSVLRLPSFLFKTGDLARYRPDGNLEFLGRIDHQVKIRGFRIELGEIEAVLLQHPALQDVVVVARDDTPGGKRLAAYLTIVGPISNRPVGSGRLQIGPTPSVAELRSFLKEKLPDYMIPSAFVVLPTLPLTPNGKVDRKALPAPDPLAFREVTSEGDAKSRQARDAVESQLVGSWEKVLGLQGIGIRDNFFELGGHSLLAVSLFVEIEKVFGQNLPLATLLAAPTVESLARILRKGEELKKTDRGPSWASLVPIQPIDNSNLAVAKRPFFCVHGVAANVLCFRQLAELLGPDQPFYGLQPIGLDGKQTPLRRIEDMAAHYIAEIRRVQANGPYFLGGFSFGGTVAYEMAQQLHDQGQKVDLLVFLDADGPARTKTFWQKLALHARIFANLSLSDQVAFLHERLGGIKARIHKLFWKLRRKPAAHLAQSLPAVIENVRMCNHQARDSYVPRPYPGKITLLRAERQPFKHVNDPYLGWGGLPQEGFEIHHVPGDHENMIQEPHVPILAQKLRQCLDMANQSRNA